MSKISQKSQCPSPTSPSRFSQWWTSWVTDWWALELASWVTAALSLIGIVIALEKYKNESPPEWAFGITLNSLISILATTGQMAMMKPTVECISQLKWLWFLRKERISSFQDFDDASRGPTGSLALLGKLRGLHLVSLGAAITIVAIAFGPFAQQVVTYPLALHATGVATIPQVFNLTTSGPELNPEIGAAIVDGLVPGKKNLSTVIPFCSTGNCTWPLYSSLGVCASVTDVSSTIISNECNATAFEEVFEISGIKNPGFQCFNYTLPEIVLVPTIALLNEQLGNATVSNGIPTSTNGQLCEMEVMTLSSTYGNFDSLSTSYLMFQPGFLSSVNSSLPSPVAYRMDLDLCMQTYNTTVLNGNVSTVVVSSQNLNISHTEVYTASNQTVSDNGNDTFITVGDNVFGASVVAYGALGLYLQETLTDICYQVIPSAFDDEAIEQGEGTFCGLSPGIAFLDVLVNSTDPLASVTEQLEGIAITLTNSFRVGTGGDTQIRDFNGTVFTPLVFVEANYLWLILPIGLVCLTLVFLLATILKSDRLGTRVWKSSNLATLQGLHTNLHTKLGGLTSISEMEEQVKKLEVRFDMRRGVEYRLLESKQDPAWL